MRCAIPLIVLMLSVPVVAADLTVGHAKVISDGIDEAQARSLGRTVEAAWKVYTTDFGFEMPKVVTVTVTCGPDQQTRLFTDGQDQMFLSIQSKEALAKPATSGVFNLYGVCHELGHMVMYRILEERGWMTGAAAEGWAHYAGSVVVDRVYAAEGEALWYDKYDYRADGTARLSKQLAEEKPAPVAQAAGLWQKLEKTIGLKGFRKLFETWQAAKVDAANPSLGLQAALVKTDPTKESALTAWWGEAAPLFVEKRPVSRFKPVVIPSNRLTGTPMLLKGDDDASEGKRSIAGGGHARLFKAPAGEWYIRAVHVYGGRYGHPKPPPNQFDVALCDAEMRTIATWKKPYSTFERGSEKWVRMEVPPTLVPEKFSLCLDFKPTAQMGVYVAWDSSTKGDSRIATPGKAGSPLGEGDWMIRVELDQPKEGNSLKQ